MSLLSLLLPCALLAAGEEAVLAATLVLWDFRRDPPSLSGPEHTQTHMHVQTQAHVI
jgi:hypothetical protein